MPSPIHQPVHSLVLVQRLLTCLPCQQSPELAIYPYMGDNVDVDEIFRVCDAGQKGGGDNVEDQKPGYRSVGEAGR